MAKVYFFILLLLAKTCIGQQATYPYIHYTTDNGLASNNTYLAYTDSKGFMWVGTDKGISRFNGIKFENFSTFDGLPDNEVLFFNEDHQGRLWLGSFNGKLCYYQNGTFHTELNTPFLKLPYLPKGYIKNILVEKDSTITISFANNLFFLSVRDEKIKAYNIEKIAGIDELGLVKCIKKINSNEFLITGVYQEIVIDTALNKIKQYKVYDPTIILGQNQDQVCLISNQPDHKIVIYNSDTFRLSGKKLLNNTDIISDAYKSGPELYILTPEGLYLYDSILLFRAKVASFNQDVRGDYWLGTTNDGIYCLSKDFMRNSLVKNVYDQPIKYAYALQHNVFFSTNKDFYSLYKGTATHIMNYAANIHGISSQQISYGLGDGKKCYTFVDYYNHFVFNDIDKKKIRIEDYTIKYTVSAGGIKKILRAGDDIYVQFPASIHRINYLPAEGHRLTPHAIVEGVDRIYCMAKENDSTIWYSRGSNLYSVKNNLTVREKQFEHTTFKNFTFFNEAIVGYTHDNKLLICIRQNGQFLIDSTHQANCIWNLFYALDSTHMLISTNDLYRLLTFHNTVKGKTYAISVIENQFLPLQPEFITSDSDNCYFFKDGSVTSVNINDLMVKPLPPRLFFNSLKTKRATWLTPDSLLVPYGESRNISIFFSTVSFGGKNIIYQYSIATDSQNSWQNIKGEQIDLYRPDYGSYIIKIRARSISGEFSEPLVLNLEILRPFWAKWWFITAVSLLIGGIIGVLIRYRILYIVKKKEQRHNSEIKFMKSEYVALNALMNPHFIFNTLNNLQTLYIEDNKKAANKYLTVFADLIRQNMHNISKDVIPLQKEMDLVENYLQLEKLRFENKLSYTISVDEGLDISEIMIPPLLIQPIVENSIKHGILPGNALQGLVNITINEKENFVNIEVRDNGIGFSKTKHQVNTVHKSFGLDNIKKRIEQLSIIQGKNIKLQICEIKNDAGNCIGTVITVSIPVF